MSDQDNLLAAHAGGDEVEKQEAGPPTPLGPPDMKAEKKRRGVCKQKVTVLITKIRALLLPEGQDVATVTLLTDKLHAEFTAFAEIHEACHAKCRPEEVADSDMYFAFTSNEYQACCVDATLWIKSREGGEKGQALETSGEDASPRENPGPAGSSDLPETSPVKTVGQLQAEVKSLTREMSGLKTLLEQALSAITAAGSPAQSAPAPVAPPVVKAPTAPPVADESEALLKNENLREGEGVRRKVPAHGLRVALGETPESPPAERPRHSSPRRSGARVSLGGVSYIPYEPDTSATADILGELTRSFRDVVEEARRSRKEDSYEGPKAKLVPFSGQAIDYWPFMKSFESQIEATTSDPRKRLNALIHYTSGEVQEMLETCNLYPAEEGYKMGLAALKEQFGDPETAAHAWMAKVKDFPAVTEVSDLRKLSMMLRRCRDTLTAMNQLEVFQTPLMLSTIVDKLPYSAKARWQGENLRIKRRKAKPCLEDVITFIHDLYLEKSDVFFGGPLEEKSQGKGNKVVPPKRTYASAEEEPEERGGSDSARAETVQVVGKPAQTAQVTICPVCEEKHPLYRCSKFKAMTQSERLDVIKEKGLCRNCFVSGHHAYRCRAKGTCHQCGVKHHTMLHDILISLRAAKDTGIPPDTPIGEADQPPDVTNVVASTVPFSRVTLPIAPLFVCNGKKSYLTYALLDTGSTCTLMTRGVVDKLGLKPVAYETSLLTLSEDRAPITHKVPSLEVVSCASGQSLELTDVLVKDRLNISLQSMARRVDVAAWPHLADLDIPTEHNGDVEVLIGQDNADFLESFETRKGPGKKDPRANRTILGWVISGHVGPAPRQGPEQSHKCSSWDPLSQQVEDFWKVQGMYDVKGEPEMSIIDKKVVDLWEQNTERCDGKYMLPIPFKENPPRVENNWVQAERALRALEYQLKRHPKRAEQYVKAVMDNIDGSHAEEVPEEELEGEEGLVYYLLYHLVYSDKKPDKPRLVFNCASKYKGKSLNDQIHSGPDLLNRLLAVLILFRQDRYAMASDISGMFNNVLVIPKHRNCMRFLFWKDGVVGGKIVVYRMRTHIFGGVWSPSCASFALRRTAADFGQGYEDATIATILKNFYMDDCLKSRSRIPQMVRTAQELREVLGKAGFPLGKFMSNETEVLKALPEETREKGLDDQALELGNLPAGSVLGSGWNPRRDSLVFTVELPDKPETKRGVLSSVSSLFDPMGLVGPVVLRAKLIFQDAHREGLQWDDDLIAPLVERWRRWRMELKSLAALEFPRCFLLTGCCLEDDGLTLELHAYSDASEDAYGANVYLRSEKVEEVAAHLVLSKGRLAPIKPMTIPRLELSAAHLAVELVNFLTEVLEATITRIIFHTDSVIVLYYVSDDLSRRPTFVANRVGFIREFTEPEQWRHVPTDLNPADIISRTATAQDLVQSDLWRHGPEYLCRPEAEWPTIDLPLPVPQDLIEIKAPRVVASTRPEFNPVNFGLDRVLRGMSVWYRMKRRVAALMKLARTLEERKKGGRYDPFSLIDLGELGRAETKILQFLQRTYLEAPEVKRKMEKLFPRREGELIRVGGRIDRAELPPGVRHPIVLPRHEVSRAILWEAHLTSHHGGSQRVLSDVRRRYWILGAARMTRSLLRKCHTCQRAKAPPCEQLMADLPAERLEADGPAFAVSGVDYFGPIYTRNARKIYKRYGVLFTCFSVRAVHLEVADSLDADDCISAILRMGARRGKPRKLFSDRGTNFVKANGELAESIAEWNMEHVQEKLRQEGYEWQFNAPSASHTGGVWERMIRSVRSVLNNILSMQTPTDDVLKTAMCLAEEVVNGRPITALSADVSDAAPLCPNDLLRPSTAAPFPPGMFKDPDRYRRKWRQAQYLTDVFWKRWRAEYLPTLQLRTKWTRPRANLKVGDLVILQDAAAPRPMWPLARIVKAEPGKDGRVRTVTLKTRKGEYERPVQKLYLIEAM